MCLLMQTLLAVNSYFRGTVFSSMVMRVVDNSFHAISNASGL